MSTKKITTNNPAQTQQIADELAHEILAAGSQNSAVILALRGDLGAGKTTFLQGFARALGIYEVVNSPTFVVMKRFKIKGQQFANFYHIDCYRLDNPEDMSHLGFAEIISNPKNIVAIEWPEKISQILPKEHIISINFDHGAENERTIHIS